MPASRRFCGRSPSQPAGYRWRWPPLAFVLLAKEASGDYARGSVLAAAYTVAEAVGAPFLGARLRNRPYRREIAVGLLASAVFFTGLAVLPDAPLTVTVIMAAAAGASGAAVPGALRAMVADLVPAKDLKAALSWESSLNMAVWAASPALVASAATWWSATVPFYTAAASATVAAGCLFALPEKTGRPETGDRRAAEGCSETAHRSLADLSHQRGCDVLAGHRGTVPPSAA